VRVDSMSGFGSRPGWSTYKAATYTLTLRKVACGPESIEFQVMPFTWTCTGKLMIPACFILAEHTAVASRSDINKHAS